MSEQVIEQLAPQLYKIEVPLPGSPLKATNSYVIKTPGRNLIIDTGMNRQECQTVMEQALKQIAIDLEQTDLFITHLHADHLGLVEHLSRPGSRIYFNRPDAAIVEISNFWEKLLGRARRFGFPEHELKRAIREHPGNKFSPQKQVPFQFIEDGEIITAGEYHLECVQTPGHTSGHTCLFDRKRKLFFSGDHILGDITPNISSWSEEDNPLEQYLQSLGRVLHMKIDQVLPGHRSIIFDCPGRIQELIQHHQQRAEEIAGILKDGEQTAFDVASKMSWDYVSDSWETFPINQKWFATGEAIAHLVYLEKKGLITKELQQERQIGEIVTWKHKN